jgi:hypothetical protein
MKKILCLMILGFTFIVRSEIPNDGFKLLSDTGYFFNLNLPYENTFWIPANYAPYILWNNFEDKKVKPVVIIKNNKKNIEYKKIK